MLATMSNRTQTKTTISPASALVMLIAAGVLGAYLLPNAPAEFSGNTYIGLHAFLLGTMLIAWLNPSIPTTTILLIGIAARSMLAFAPEFTSNDMERYLWDGAVTLNGFDPYTMAPDNPAVAHLRNMWPTPPEHTAYATLYPPGAIALFSLSAIAGPTTGIMVWKALATFASIASLFFVRAILERRDLSQHFPLFALSPLLLLETGIGGHMDIFVMLSVVVAIHAVDRKNFYLAGLALGIGASIKFLPIILAAPIVVYMRFQPRTVINTVLGIATPLLILYGTALFLGMSPIGTISVFFEKWRGGSPVYAVLEHVLTAPHILVVQILGIASIAVYALLTAWRGNFILAMALFLTAPLLFSPIVFPWYLSVLAPFVALCSSATLFFWLATAPLTYEVLNGWRSIGVWDQASWPLWIIGAMFIFGFLIDLRRIRPQAVS